MKKGQLFINNYLKINNEFDKVIIYNYNMIYLIYGHQLPVIKKALKNLVKQCLNGEEINEFNYIRISSRLELVQDIVFDCMSLPMFCSRKVVVVSEPYYLSTEKEKNSLDKDQDYNKLIGYINNPSEHTDLIFFLESKNVDTKSNIYKAICKSGKVMAQEVLTEQMLKNMGMAIFTKKNVTISQEALEELVNKCGDDVSKFTNEANKLSLYKNDLTLDDVKLLVCDRLEDNAFNIVEALICNKINKALKVYYDLRINKEEPVKLIALIASQFRFMLEVNYLLSEHYSNDYIANELKCKPYRVSKTIQTLCFIKSQELRNVIDYLYNLDYQIKAGEKDPYFNFELFLINFNQIKAK